MSLNTLTIVQHQQSLAHAKRQLTGKNSTAYEFNPMGRFGLNGDAASLKTHIIEELDFALGATDKEYKELAQLEEQARKGDSAALTSLNGARLWRINNFLFAAPKFSSLMFEQVILKKGELPVLQFATKGEVNVAYIGETGETDIRPFKNADFTGDENVIPWGVLSSEFAEYRLLDLQTGDVSNSAKDTFDLGRDMAVKVNERCFTLATASLKGFGPVYGSFTTTGVKNRLKTYFPHSVIKVANLPTTNSLSGSITASAAAIKSLLEAVLQYGDSWAEVWGAPMVATGEILCASSQTGYFLSAITTINQQIGETSEGIIRDYTRFSYGGRTWTMIPDATLAPNTFYFRMSQPGGTIFTMPDSAFNQEEVITERSKNRERRRQHQQICFAVPEPYKVKFLRAVLT